MMHKRHELIMELLYTNKIINNTEIIDKFSISPETVRRDLKYLENKGLLKRVYGGAVLKSPMGIEPEFSRREVLNLEEKRAIAQKASSYIEDGDTIIIDLGTTPLEVAKAIENKNNLKILTNSINVALETLKNDKNTVYMLGGHLRKGENATSGFLCEENLNHFRVDKAIIGAAGITLESGITDFFDKEAQVRKKMIESANNVIVVADYSKFGITAFCKVCDLSHINMIITDWKTPKTTLNQYKNNNINIIVAEKNVK